MKLAYPNYEMIFSVQDERDEALPVVRMILDKYPSIDTKIIIG
jgi:ceramide glucosyltransferase